ncbi:MAG: hypothetical protein ABI791_11960 [Acidobacteriota bacterium]
MAAFFVLCMAGMSAAQSRQPADAVHFSPRFVAPPNARGYFTRGAKAYPSDRAAKIKRWFEFDELSVHTRYRFVENARGDTVSNQQQYRFAGRGRFKFDSKGRYSVVAGLFTGNSITGGWNNTGVGTGDVQTNLYLKQLYFDANPVKGLEIQVGGIAINNGENTEATGYDNDVYLTGERVVFRLPKKVYFDEISLASAHIGEFNHPSVFRRFDNFAKSNYHQFLVRKQVNKRVGFSADYTFESGSDTFRQAVKIKTSETHFVDHVVFENYQRFDGPGKYGFNVFGERKVGKKLTLDAGFARIDGRLLNGDRFPQGNLFHATATYKFSPEFSLSTFIIHGAGPMAPTLPRTRFELIFSYNLLETLRRHKLQ